jgi:hypothetical protein
MPEATTPQRNNWRLLILGIVILGLVICCLFVLPTLIVPLRSDASLTGVTNAKERIELQDGRRKLQNDVRATLLQGLAGAFFLITAYFTWRQVQNSQDQLSVAREGQITERFTRAIDQLGSQSIDTRIGGIYALERIANDSQHELDREQITGVLTAFVRGRSPWPQPSVKQRRVKRLPFSFQRNSKGRALELPKLRIRASDVQTALDVLSRLPSPTNETDVHFSLGNADLRYAHLQRANLRRVSLRGSNLQKAWLWGADLQEARLDGADLREAHLARANLRGASVRGANLDGAYLKEEPDLTETEFNKQTVWPKGFDPIAAGALEDR